MRFLQSLILFAVVAWFVPANSCDGQLVRINNNGFGGVNIRAPFVRINTSPYGGTNVRAPFVNINTPPPAYYQPRYYRPSAPYRGYRQQYYRPNAPVYGTPVPAPDANQPVQPTVNQSQFAPSNAPVARPTYRDPYLPNRTYATPSTVVPGSVRTGTVTPSAPPAEAKPGQPTKAPTRADQMKSVLDRNLPPANLEELPAPRPAKKDKR